MFEISYSDDAITFVNVKTNKAEKLSLFDAMPDLDAIRVVNSEIKGRDSASKASVSLLSHLLNSPRLDGYKGTCPLNEAIPKELKSAIRDIETEYLKPIFCAPLVAKKATPATVEAQWQGFAQGLREGGSYANTKSRVMAYFSHMGMLPITSNGKLLTVAAIDKILMNEKEKLAKPATNEGIAGKLVKLSLEIEIRTEKTELGDFSTAIAALNAMLDTYQGLQREVLEKMTSLIGNVSLDSLDSKVCGVIAKAMAQESTPVDDDSEESLTTAWNAGQMDDAQFSARMSAIGIDVEITA